MMHYMWYMFRLNNSCLFDGHLWIHREHMMVKICNGCNKMKETDTYDTVRPIL